MKDVKDKKKEECNCECKTWEECKCSGECGCVAMPEKELKKANVADVQKSSDDKSSEDSWSDCCGGECCS